MKLKHNHKEISLSNINIIESLASVIDSKEMKQELENLNEFFFNRKHENQIRDYLIKSLCTNFPQTIALSEFPKIGHGAVDLSWYEGDNLLSTLELKHQYPGDLSINKDVDKLVSDTPTGKRCVITPTTHFLLILQSREQIKPLESLPTSQGKYTFGDGNYLKFMERNKTESETQELLENFEKKIEIVDKKIVHQRVSSSWLKSEYSFYLYEF